MNHAFCALVKIDELDALEINHPSFKATLLLQGAQLIQFRPRHKNFENILWLSPSAEYKKEKPIRGGIPICWPWFGNLDKNPESIQHQIEPSASASAHGFARSALWEIKSVHEDCKYIEITLSLSSNLVSKTLWPFDFHLEAKFKLSTKLELTLTTTNTGTKNFTISQALHTYLPTKNIHHSYIHNTHDLKYIDALDYWAEKKQVGKIPFTEETDRLYFFNHPEYLLRLETPQQSLLLHSRYSQSAVIWNPWVEKSKHLSQFDPTDFMSMLCIETANVLTDSKRIKAGKEESIFMALIAED